MTLCIFCEAVLTATTKPEHILLDALGGRKTTRRAICSDHNNQFGAGIDKAITSQVASFRTLLQLDSGTGKSAPSLRVQNNDGERLILRPDGTPELIQKPFVVTQRADGDYDIQINARDEADLVRIVPHVAAQTRMTEEDVWKQLGENGSGAWQSRRPGTVHQELMMGGEDSLRSICKAALCLLATTLGTTPLRADVFADVRNFVLSGSAAFNRERGSLDPRRLPNADYLEENFGPLFNLLYVRSNEDGRVVAHFTLYNLIAWQAVLAEQGGPPNVNLALASDPVNPTQWSDKIIDQTNVPFDWLNSPDHTDLFPASQRRISGAFEVWQQRGQALWVGRIVNRVFERHGIMDDHEPVRDKELWQIISAEIADEIAHHVVGATFQRPFTQEDLERARQAGKSSK